MRRQEVIEMEGKILAGLDYCLPVMRPKDEADVMREVFRVQSLILSGG